MRDFLANVDRYLVYGCVLGLASKVTKSMAALIPADQVGVIVPWYIYSAAHGDTFAPAAFGDAISTLVTTVSTTMSSAAGTGGGASAGGGGGAGGSGGGAG